MKNSFKLNGFLLILAIVATILIYDCGSDSVTTPTAGPDPGTISGTVTFTDTNKVQCSTCGYYDIAAFSSWPPTGPPSSYDTLKLTKANNVYTATYKMIGLTGGGSYVIVAAYTKLPYAAGSNFILGIHGCDNNESCYLTNPKHDTIPSAQGLANINFNAFCDTASSHVKF